MTRLQEDTRDGLNQWCNDGQTKKILCLLLFLAKAEQYAVLSS